MFFAQLSPERLPNLTRVRLKYSNQVLDNPVANNGSTDTFSQSEMNRSAVTFLSMVALACQLLTSESLFGQSATESLLRLELNRDAELIKLTEPVQKLETNYEGHLTQLFSLAQTSGNLDHVLEVKKELEGFRNGSGQDPITYSELAKARAVYDSEFAKIESSLAASREAVVENHILALTALQISLTKQHRLDEALEVKEALLSVEGTRSKRVAAPVTEEGAWIIALVSEDYESKFPIPADRPVSDEFCYVESNDTFGILHLTFDDPRIHKLGLRIEKAVLRFGTANVRLAETLNEIRVMAGQAVVGRVKGAPSGKNIEVELNSDTLSRMKPPFRLSLRCGDDAVIVMNSRSDRPASLVLTAN